MSKPLIFISHIGAESEVATLFQGLISKHFLGMFDVFVSSDGASISMGQKWLNDITAALKTCVIEIIVASPHSVPRPWINFEAGSGWVRDIPVIPLCHSGAEPSKLPVPLNMLQGARATNKDDLEQVLDVLAKQLACTRPTVDFTTFIADVGAFEHRYLFWDEVNRAFQAIHDVHDGIIPVLLAGNYAQITLTEDQIKTVESHCAFLNQHGIVRGEFRLATAYGPSGAQLMCRFHPGAQLQSTTSAPQYQSPG